MPHEELATGVIATKEKASELIDNALTRIKKRDDAKKAGAERRAEYHANKDNGGSEYPPRRYSQDHPPNGEDSANGETPESASAPAPARKAEDEQKIYRIHGVNYTDKKEATAAVSKAIFG